MNYTDFKNSIINGEVSSIYLFEGEDSYFRESGLNLLKKHLGIDLTLNYASLDSDAGEDEIISAITSYPMFGDKKITVIREFYPDANVLNGELGNCLEHPIEKNVFVILNQKASANLQKYSKITIVDCNKMNASNLARFVKSEFAIKNVNADMETCKVLCEYCQCLMTKIDMEMQKLIAYLGEGGTLSINTINELVIKDTEYKIYELTDYISRKQFDSALNAINDFLAKGETFSRLILSLYNYYRRLLHIAISTKTDSELATLLGIKEYAVVKTRQQAKRFKVKGLKMAVDLLADSEYKIKSGQMQDSTQFWLSLYKIMLK